MHIRLEVVSRGLRSRDRKLVAQESSMQRDLRQAEWADHLLTMLRSDGYTG